MTSLDLLVRGGTVVTGGGSRRADVGVLGGWIEAIEAPGVLPEAAAERSVDAEGLLVLPGVVDVHTHTRVATDAQPDRFFQDSVAAAHGGTTTFLSFNNPGTGISEGAQRTLRSGIDEWLLRTAGDSAIDYGLSAVITAQQEDPAGDLEHAIRRGIPTLKAFMVYDFGIEPGRLRTMLSAVAQAGGMLELHCEDPTLLQRGIASLERTGRTRPADHAASRPVEVEAAGTAAAVGWARQDGQPLYVVHLSCREALWPAVAAKREGARVFVESCPHFLALDDSRYRTPDHEAIAAVVSPPLRSPDQRDALWRGLGDGSIDVIATDHVPDRLAVEKRYVGQPFTTISNGAPGIETLLAIVYSEGVAAGRISVERMVEVLCTAPARLFGLRHKGAIQVGRDADLVLFDPLARRTIHALDLHHTSDYTPYEGMRVRGAVRRVMVRGQDVIHEGRFVGRRGFGRYQARALEPR